MIVDRNGLQIKTTPSTKMKTGQRWKIGGSNDPLIYTWGSSIQTINELLQAYLPTIRARCRQQVRDNDYAARFVRLVVTNVIGHSGIQLQAQSRNNDGTLDTNDNDAIEKAFKDWSNRKNCDISERYTYHQIQTLIASTWANDGEVFIRKIKTPSSKYGFQLQLIDPELCSTQINKDLGNGIAVRLGIEINAVGKALAYYFSDMNPGSMYYNYNQMTPGTIRVPADEVIHIYLPQYINQLRGIPPLATSLYRMKMLDGYEEAALVNARTGASKMGFFTESESGDQYEGDEVESDGSYITNAQSGQFHLLPHGVDFKTFNPDYPNQEFQPFVKQVLRGVAAGLGPNYNTLAGDLESINYSSARIGAADDREIWKGLQETIIEMFCRPVYEEWLEMGLLKQAIIGPTGIPLPSFQYEKYRNVRFQPRRWLAVDPNKQLVADKMAIELNLKSRSEIIMESGGDPESTFRSIAAERQLMESLGLPLTSETPKEVILNQTDEETTKD